MAIDTRPPRSIPGPPAHVDTEDVDRVHDRMAWFYKSRRTDGVARDMYAKGSAVRHRIQKELPKAPPGGPGSVNWTPLGPSLITHGQASGHPGVSGRINGLAVGPGGERIYAGAANGGVWLSEDSGDSWRPLDDYLMSPTLLTAMQADSLSVGAIAVVFGSDRTDDVIFVGTGEPQSSFDQPLGDGYFGIGVRVSTGGGDAGTWDVEADNLAGHGMFRLVVDPDDTDLVFAATSTGIFRRPRSGSRDAWDQVTDPLFRNPTGAVSDLIVAGSGTDKHYYAAFWDDGVYKSRDGSSWIALTGVSTGRIVLAAGESDHDVVYALDETGALFRLVGHAFEQVTGTPPIFPGRQGGYDIVLAVDPSSPEIVYLGGDITFDQDDYTLALFRGAVSGGPGSWSFPFNPANSGNNGLDSSHDATWIGRGIHPDVHSFAFGLTADGSAHDGSIVWVGCDGGMFASTDSGQLGTFVPRNEGMAVVELTYIAADPTNEAIVWSGCQDNGNLRRRGDSVWYESPEGDGGGVAVDPNDPLRIMRQYHNAGSWDSTGTQFFGALHVATDGGQSESSWSVLNFPPQSASPSAAFKAATNQEDGATGFYAPIVTSPAGETPTLAVFGTYRVWMTADWGSSWVTLPTGTNPYAHATPDLNQDRLDGSSVTALQYPTPDLLLAATSGGVWRFDRSGTTWSMTPIPTSGLPASASITGVAVEDPMAGTMYVTLGGGGVDHVWYFDGTSWRSAGLSQGVLDVPAHGVVLDPDDSNSLYIGTDVGCWHGEKTGPTSWTWRLFSDGLPEAAIMDIQIHAASRLLRVATHGRGAWEIPIDETAGADPELFVRANAADAGHRLPGIDVAPDPTAPGQVVDLTMSPDVKVRRGIADDPAPPFPGRILINTTPMMSGPDVKRWQAHMASKGWALKVDGFYGPISKAVCAAFQQENGLGVDGRVGPETWPASCGYPALGPDPTAFDFSVNVGDDIDRTTRTGLADATGTNRVLVQVHNRGHSPVAANDVTVLLLMAATSGGPPAFPADLATRVAALDDSNWPDAAGWSFADPTSPYRQPPSDLTDRLPQVVEYDVDFAATSFSDGDEVTLAVIAHTPSDAFTSTETDPVTLVGADRHVALRTIRLVAVTPFP
jgi:hypothetical protein